VGIVVGVDRARHHDVDREAVRRVRASSARLRQQLRAVRGEAVDQEAAGWLLALAYPDRVAQRRAGAGERFLLRNGLGAVLDDAGGLAGSPFLAVADVDGRVPHARIFLAAGLERVDVDRLFGTQVVHEKVLEWDATAGAVVSRRRERLGAIVLRDIEAGDVEDTAVVPLLLQAIARGDGLALRWSDEARRLRERLAFLRRLDEAWPDASDEALSTGEWLAPHLAGARRRSDVERVDLAAVLLDALTWEQRRALDALAPTHVVVPSGSRIPVDYGDPDAPVLAVRLQEMFGLTETPRVGGGRVALTLHLLSPARRPVQVTRDLAGFWRSSYFEVRKELRGRYPKHEWPEDPLAAAPTHRAKPRR
jgi:ATP-dependent helicase HrpB